MASSRGGKPHAVCIPGPLQSHIKAMLKLAKLLHHEGFHITFVNTEFNHKRFLKSRGPNSLDGLPDFRFESIPDGLPSSDADANQDLPSLVQSITTNFLAPFRDLLAKLNATASSNVPPVTCIVSDGILSFTITAAKELGIPVILFFTVAACVFMSCCQHRSLLEKGLVPLKDTSYLTNGYLDTIIDWIPGMKNIRLKDLSSFVLSTEEHVLFFNFSMEVGERASEASAIVLNTFDELERDVLDALSDMFPIVYTIGPLQMFLNQISEDDHSKSIGYNLWKEEPECLQWLNSKEPNSVIYVNFGSIITLAPQQLIELAWGLANSKYFFLWIIRPDLVSGDSAILPPEFVVETKERSMISNWCPQEDVLNHSSIGGFLTHSGWNSTIESISAGVPMLCWPVSGDQLTNCRYACNEWEIGMEIDNNVSRDEVERLVRELMDGEKGRKLKNKALEWKKMAAKATDPDGSSFLNLNKLVNKLLR